jgi:hypothetical protein
MAAGAGREIDLNAKSSTPYTRSDRIFVISSSALIGWAYFSAKYLVGGGSIGGLPFFALFGLPVAFAVTWLIAGPILFWFIRTPVSWYGAACWGAAISGLMALLGFGLARFQGWQASQNPSWNYTIGGGDFVQDVDGVLTPYGWWIALQTALEFIMLGIVVALIIRAIIGTRAKVAAE